MLAANNILKEITESHISICPFNMENLGPISYDMSIDNEITILNPKNGVDTRKGPESLENQETIKIDEDGYWLKPGLLYLAKTKEEIWSDTYVPCVSGRSSFARAGVIVHHTSFFANPGHKFKWILEISVTIPVKIYPDSKICQLYFEEMTGDTKGHEYNGKYLNDNSNYGFLKE